MMNAGNLKEKTRQISDWRRRLLAFVLTLSLLISSCGLTAFAETDDDVYSAPVTAPIPAESSTSPEPEEASVTPAPEGEPETGTESEEGAPEGTEPEEGTNPEEGTEPEEGTNPEEGTEPEEGTQDGTEEGSEEGTEPEEGTKPEGGTEPEGESPEGTEPEAGTNPEEGTEPEDLTVYEPGTLTAEAEDVEVTIDYTAEARVPEGTVLSLNRAAGSELYSALKSAAKVLKTEANETWQREVGDEAVFYNLSLTSPEGVEVRPQTGVSLSFRNLTIPAGATGFVTGSYAENIDWEDALTVDFLPDAIGYAYLKQVQIGAVTLIHEGPDYTVTASYGPEAGFPFGTDLKVHEVMPGTPEYALYSGMTEEAMSEEWTEVTLERYFDITFVLGETELEPQGDVDVQITFKEAIEQTEEVEVQAVHIENNEATVIESNTDSTEVAQNIDEAIDTVSFTSDSFSVFGVVQKKKIVTKVLDAQGNTYEIDVTYTQEAEIPEDAQVKVEEIPEGSDLWEAYRKQTAAALEADDVVMPGLYDISIIDAEGNKVEPKVPVSVAIKLLNEENTTSDIQVVHFTEEIPQELVEAVSQSEEPTSEETEEQIEEQTSEETEEQTEVQTEVQPEPLAEEDKIASETITAKVEDNIVTFDTKGFSVYAFAYTVDFTYVDEEGNVYEWSFPGLGKYPITDVLNAIGVEAEVENVTLKLKEGELIEGALYLTKEDDIWYLNSDVAFTDIYELRIYTEQGVYAISVTDAAYSVKYSVNNVWQNIFWGSLGGKFTESSYSSYVHDVATNNGAVVSFTVNAGVSKGYGITTSARWANNREGRFAFWLKDDGTYPTTRDHGKIIDHNANAVNRDTTFIAYFAPADEYVVVINAPRGSNNNNRAIWNANNGWIASNVDWDRYAEGGRNYYFSGENIVLTAVPASGCEFIGWYNGNELISREQTFSVKDAKKDLVLEARFWHTGDPMNIYISSNDYSLGTISSNQGGTVPLNDDRTVHYSVNAYPVSGAEFLHWTVNGIPVPELGKSFDYTNGYKFAPNDQVQAVFGVATSVNPTTGSTTGKTISNKDELHDWAESLKNNQIIRDADKTAAVGDAENDYDNRIYKIDLTASSGMRRLVNSIDVAFILDMSGSMRFPSNLVPVQKNGSNLQMVLTQENLNAMFPGEEGPYYIISDPNYTSTVYKIYKKDGIWGSTDGSFQNHYPITGTERFNEPANGAPYKYTIYRDASSDIRRLDALNSSMNKALTTAKQILNNANGINGSNNFKVDFSRFAYDVFVQPSGFKEVTDIGTFSFTDSDTAGGTRQDLALANARTAFNWGDSHSKYAILITDGAPVVASDSGINLSNVFSDIETNAQALKDDGVTLITVGLSTRNVAGGSDMLSRIASDGLFYDAENSNELEYILLDILQSIMAEANIQANVTDTIDPLFYPVQADGTPIQPGTYGDQTWTKNADGSWTVTWANQTLGWGSSGEPGWNRSINVKAKEDFLGGNAMPTNKGNATITPTGVIDGDDQVMSIADAIPVELNTPYVNVKELKFTEHNSEITVRLGDEVDPIVAIKALFDQIDVQKLVSGDTNNMITNRGQMLGKSYSSTNVMDLASVILKDNSSEKVVKDPMGEGMSRWAKMLFGPEGDKTLAIRYGYGNHYRVGEIQISLEQVIKPGETGLTGSYNSTDKTGTITSVHKTTVSGDAVETYTLTVKYVPREASSRVEKESGVEISLGSDLNWHTTPGKSPGRDTDDILSTNVHIINVLPPVEIEALKVWDGYTPQDGDQVVLQLYSVAVTPEPNDTPSDDPTDPPSDDPTDPPSDDPTDPPSGDPTDPPSDDPTDPPTVGMSFTVNVHGAPQGAKMWMGVQDIDNNFAFVEGLSEEYGSRYKGEVYNSTGVWTKILYTATTSSNYQIGWNDQEGNGWGSFPHASSGQVQRLTDGQTVDIYFAYDVQVSINEWTGGSTVDPEDGSVLVTFHPTDDSGDIVLNLNNGNRSDKARLYAGKNYSVSFDGDGTVITDVDVNNNASTSGITESSHGAITLSATVAEPEPDSDKQTFTVKVDEWLSGNPWGGVTGRYLPAPSVGQVTVKIFYNHHRLDGDEICTFTLDSGNNWQDSRQVRPVSSLDQNHEGTGYVVVLSCSGIEHAFHYGTTSDYKEYNTDDDQVVRLACFYSNSSSINNGILAFMMSSAYADAAPEITHIDDDTPDDAVPLSTITLDGTSDENGEYAKWRAKWTNLPAMDEDGNLLYYYVREYSASMKTEATYSYAYDSSGKRITLVTITNVPDGSKVIPDEVEVIKQDDKGADLTGAIFTLYKDAACTQEVTTYGGSGISRFVISTEDGELGEILPKENGGTLTLYLKETTPPTGYQIQDPEAYYTINITTEVSDPKRDPELNRDIVTTTYTMTIDGEESITVENPPVTDHVYAHNSVTVYKTDGTSELAGATFALFNEESQIKEYVMGANTSFVIEANDAAFDSLRPAPGESITLTLKETVTPEGYLESDAEYSVVLSTSETTAWNTGHTMLVTTTTYSVSINSADELTVPNTPVGSIQVVKAVTDNGEESNVLDGKIIRIGLFPGGSEPTDEAVAETVFIKEMTITGQTTTELLYEDLELGTYWVYELDTENHPIKNGGTVTIESHVYTVTETGPDVNLEEAGQQATINITNNKEGVGDLIVKKVVAGDAADHDKEFNFTVTQTNLPKIPDGQYGTDGMVFADGVATFTLKDGESMVAIGLPYGFTYEVTETEMNEDDYVTTSTIDTSFIDQSEANYFISTEETETVTYRNAKYGNSTQFVVKKEWIDIIDASNMPSVYFSLKYYTEDQQPEAAQVYGDYDEIELNATSSPAWTWICPETLPEEIEGKKVSYFAQEKLIDENHPEVVCDYHGLEIPPELADKYAVQLEGYENSNGLITHNTFQRPFEVAIQGNTGSITIRNRAPSQYMQMDIKKKFLEYRTDPSGAVSLWTTTHEGDTKKNRIIEVQLMRRYIDERIGTYEYVSGWIDYGNTLFVGYDTAGKPVIDKHGNLFELENAGGDWHYRIPNSGQNQGLPRRGFEIVNRELTPVRYQYIIREVAVYDGNRNPLNGEEWASWLPYAWDAITDTAEKVKVLPLKVCQDDDRFLDNIPASYLTVEKGWAGNNSNVQEIYVKVYRRPSGSTGAPEDYTKSISEQLGYVGTIGPNHFPGGYSGMLDPAAGRQWLILNESNGWQASIHNMEIIPYQQGQRAYEYFIEEVGYKDKDGVHLFEEEGNPFNPEYYIWENDKWVNHDHGVGISLNPNGSKNKLKVTNTLPNGSLKITKIVKVGSTVASDLTGIRKNLADGKYTFYVYSDYTDESTKTEAVKVDGTAVNPVEITVKNGVATTVEVEKLPAGTYYIKETASTNSSVTLDETVYEVTVKAGKSGDDVEETGLQEVTNVLPLGSLRVTKSVESTSGETIEGTFSYPITIMVTIDDNDYYVQDTDGELGTEEPVESLTVTNKADLIINNLPYGEYVVTETEPNTVEVTGYKYIEVTGSVSSGTGTVSETQDEVELVNKYTKNTSWTPKITKLLNEEDYTGSEFSFILTETTTGRTHTETINSAVSGAVTFTAIPYSLTDLGGNTTKDFTYTITEALGTDPNMAYDSTVIYLKVTLTKDANGVLSAAGTYYSDEELTTEWEEPTFRNKGLGKLTVKKIVEGRTPDSGETYPFTIKVGDKYVSTVLSGSDHVYAGLSDESIEYSITAGDAGIMTFTKLPVGIYTVAEGSVDNQGYLLTTTYAVTDGTTTDDGANASVTKGNSTAVTITNTYETTGIRVRKTKMNDEFLAGTKFKVVKLKDDGTAYAADDPEAYKGEEQQINSEEGVTFDELKIGKYQLIETEAAAGYLLLAEKIVFEVSEDNGALVISDKSETHGMFSFSKVDDEYVFKVKNQPGTELPSTGGSGTLIYTVTGIFLIALAGVILVSRKKRKV